MSGKEPVTQDMVLGLIGLGTNTFNPKQLFSFQKVLTKEYKKLLSMIKGKTDDTEVKLSFSNGLSKPINDFITSVENGDESISSSLLTDIYSNICKEFDVKKLIEDTSKEIDFNGDASKIIKFTEDYDSIGKLVNYVNSYFQKEESEMLDSIKKMMNYLSNILTAYRIYYIGYIKG